MSDKHVHLQMIQGIINRLSSNSFLLKGWSVVLISAMFALAAGGKQLSFVLLAYLPAFVFWGLDGYFLHQERLFRELYDHVRGLSEEDIDFSMNHSRFKDDVDPWSAVTVSTTLVAFHGIIVITIVFVTIVSVYL